MRANRKSRRKKMSSHLGKGSVCLLSALAAATLWLLAALSPAAAAEVKNVEIVKVENRLLFTYDLEGEENETMVSVHVTVGDRTFPSKQLHLEGDLGRVRTGKNRRVTWYVLNDFPQGLRQPVSVEILSGFPRIVNAVGMAFVLVPAGAVTMGSPVTEPGRQTDEMQQRITVGHAFYLQVTEVTQGQWRSVMGSNPAHFRQCGELCPVEQVSWREAQEFIRKLNLREGTNAYRLPTEAEWEYAARAGTSTAYYWGANPDCSRANFGNSLWSSDCKGMNPGKTMPVASFRPNPWGLYDMTGNVWEWVQSDDVAKAGLFRIQRGGAWDSDANSCRMALRAKALPDAKLGHLKLNPGTLGLRLVRSAN